MCFLHATSNVAISYSLLKLVKVLHSCRHDLFSLMFCCSGMCKVLFFIFRIFGMIVMTVTLTERQVKTLHLWLGIDLVLCFKDIEYYCFFVLCRLFFHLHGNVLSSSVRTNLITSVMPLTNPGLVLSQRLNSLPPVLPSRFPTPCYHLQRKYSVRELTQLHQNSCLDLSPPRSLNFLPLLSMRYLVMARALRSEKMSKLHQGSSLHSVKRMLVIKVQRKGKQSTVRTPQWNIMLVGLWAAENTLPLEGA